MTVYSVHKADGNDQVVIALDGYGPTTGFTEVGTFEHGVDEENAQTDPNKLTGANGDHIFIVKAKEVLRDSEDFGHLNVDKLTFLDRASNAPLHDNEAVSTNAMDVTEDGGHPDASTQKGGEISTAGTDPAQTEANGVDDKPSETGSENSEDDADDQEDEHDGETVKQLKERVAGITDKDELQKAYDDEKAGKNRPTAIAAIEKRAGELEA